MRPVPKLGGKIGLFGGAGVGKTVFIMELINNIAKALHLGLKHPLTTYSQRCDPASNAKTDPAPSTAHLE